MRTSLLAAAASLLFLPGCSEMAKAELAGTDCSDIESDVVGISKGQLVKIAHKKEVSRSDTEVVCSGDGYYSNAEWVPTVFRAYLDDEGDALVEFRQVPATTAAEESVESADAVDPAIEQSAPVGEEASAAAADADAALQEAQRAVDEAAANEPTAE